MVAASLVLLALSAAGLFAAGGSGGDLGWLDSISRLGVVAFLVMSLVGLHRRWWVPGWAYSELQERHERLRSRYDKAVETALRSSRGVQRTATVLEEALTRADVRRDPE